MTDYSNNLFNIPTRMERKRLTTRQYNLHDLLLEHSKRSKERLTHQQMLERMDYEYEYSIECQEYPNREFNNLSARRQLSDDLDAITTFGDFHKVYVGGRYATSELEIEIRVKKEEIRIKKQLWKLSQLKKKAGLNGQMVMQFSGYEKDEWQSYIQSEEEQLNEMEKAYEKE